MFVQQGLAGQKYVLVQKNRINGKWEPVVLVIGYADNAYNCDIIKNTMAVHSGAVGVVQRCVPY